GVTLSDNFSYAGGGINNEGSDNPAGQLWVTNSTLSQNSADNYAGGLDNYHARATLLNVTLAGNFSPVGGNLSQVGALPTQTLTVTASILVHGTSGGNCLVNSGAVNIVSGDYNLADDTTCNTYFSQPHDQKNVPAQLGPLADNGGPTLTYLPADASPAVEHGGPGCPSTDQRGFGRPHGAACDAGSVEVGAVPLAKLYLPLLLR
ncbi:MAG: choice-of-anchor Q domain-containing protein, partial [Anaerolineales bacterium]